jgi:hypothetical protein
MEFQKPFFLFSILLTIFFAGCINNEPLLESVDLTTLVPQEDELPKDFYQYLKKYFMSNDNSSNELFVGYKKEINPNMDSETFYDLGVWIIEFDEVEDTKKQMELSIDDIYLSEDIVELENFELKDMETKSFIYTHQNKIDSQNTIPSKSVIVGSRKNNYFFTVTTTALVHEDDDYLLENANHYLSLIHQKISTLESKKE